LDRRNHIVESAQILFAQFGLKKVTSDDIAREAGVSKATLYKYFSNKTEVFSAVIDKEVTQLLQAIESAVSAQASPIEQLRAHLLTRLTKVDDFVNFYRVTHGSWGDYWPDIARVRQRFLQQEQEIVEGILKRGVASGELCVENTRQAALALVLALASVEQQWSDNEHELRLPEFVDLMLTMIVEGIRKRQQALDMSDVVVGQKVESAAHRRLRQGYHSFHIPVMGTGFTVDTPIRVAKYGISSVIAIGDDVLLEQMREHYCREFGKPFIPIGRKSPDSRAHRIRAYLDLVNESVSEQVESVRTMPFLPGSDICRYFELLPNGPLRASYVDMVASRTSDEKKRLQELLRRYVVPGRIEVNIMSKIDRDEYIGGTKGAPENGVAMSALRGFATSKLNSAVVLSAGLNRRLYSYMAQFEDFFSQGDDLPRKQVIVKVSDFRSALLQGKMLARHGIWVSEFRIESGLNCGGHAFPTHGELLGPILEEFKSNRSSLDQQLKEMWTGALIKQGREPKKLPPIRLTVQGGVGTSEEHDLLFANYEVDSVGWGTPFLLVPEATNVDAEHLKKLTVAGEQDVLLSNRSPIGIPFWILTTSESERHRRDRADSGNPGRFCTKGYLAMDSEFSQVPLCPASTTFQALKLEQLSGRHLPPLQEAEAAEDIVAKTCLCADLAAGVLNRNGSEARYHTAVCCGPNIANFNRVASLREMVDHIYGRLSLIASADRPNMFIKELSLYIENYVNEQRRCAAGLTERTAQYFSEYKRNLERGIQYYRAMASRLCINEYDAFLAALDRAEVLVRELTTEISAPVALSTAV
jgi:AcrR family transcriptional regulator